MKAINRVGAVKQLRLHIFSLMLAALLVSVAGCSGTCQL